MRRMKNPLVVHSSGGNGAGASAGEAAGSPAVSAGLARFDSAAATACRSVSGVIGVPVSTSLTPIAFAYTNRPSTTIAIDAAGSSRSLQFVAKRALDRHTVDGDGAFLRAHTRRVVAHGNGGHHPHEHTPSSTSAHPRLARSLLSGISEIASAARAAIGEPAVRIL